MTKAVQFIKITLKCNMEIAVFAENLVSEVNIRDIPQNGPELM